MSNVKLLAHANSGSFEYLSCDADGHLAVSIASGGESLVTIDTTNLATIQKQDDIIGHIANLDNLTFVSDALKVTVDNQPTTLDVNITNQNLSVVNTVTPIGSFANILASMDINSGQMSAAFDCSDYRESVLSWEDTSVTSSASIDILASRDGTSYVFIGSLYPIKEGVSTVRRASAKLSLAPFMSLKVQNIGANTVQGISCSLFSA